MQEHFLEATAWAGFWSQWGETLARVPGMKEEMLRRVGNRMQEELQGAIGSSGLHDSRGRVAAWQNPHLGSGGGYVAIRADSVEVAAGGNHRQRLNAGALTNFLTSGHRVRGPSGRTERYQPRGTMARVPGYHFYQATAERVEAIAAQEAKALIRELEEQLK
ncbi:MAG: hypothetical protein RRY97_10065 [Oscillibacter sp.]